MYFYTSRDMSYYRLLVYFYTSRDLSYYRLLVYFYTSRDLSYYRLLAYFYTSRDLSYYRLLVRNEYRDDSTTIALTKYAEVHLPGETVLTLGPGNTFRVRLHPTHER